MERSNFEYFSFEGYTKQECRNTGKQPISEFPQQARSSHKYERDFYHALPGIMNSQPWSSTGSKQYCKATIEPYATILKAEDFSAQEFSLFWTSI